MNSKRKKFTEHEKKILISIIQHPKLYLLPVLQRMDCSARGRHEKKIAWEKISKLFNINVKHTERTIDQLKNLWKNFKSKASLRRKLLISAIMESKLKERVKTDDEKLDGKYILMCKLLTFRTKITLLFCLASYLLIHGSWPNRGLSECPFAIQGLEVLWIYSTFVNSF